MWKRWIFLRTLSPSSMPFTSLSQKIMENNPIVEKYGHEPRFVNYKLVEKEQKNGEIKLTKEPFSPITRRNASTIRETDWGTYIEAVEADFERIGIVFLPDQKMTGFDIDHCLNKETGEIDHPEKEKIEQFLNEANTYVEISPSKTGLHAIFENTEAWSPIAKRHEGYEVYTSGRYFTFTKNPYKVMKTVRTVTPEQLTSLAEILGYPWNKKSVQKVQKVREAKLSVSSLSDGEVLGRMFASKNGDKIRRLYNGDISQHQNDYSRADMALVSHLAFWTGKDRAQIERLWLASALGNREKTQTRKDYRDCTIDEAISNDVETYNPSYLAVKDLVPRKVAGQLLDKDKDQLKRDKRRLAVYAYTFYEKNPNLKVTRAGQFYDYFEGVYRAQTRLDMQNRVYRSLSHDMLGDIASTANVIKILNQLTAHVASMTESDSDPEILNVKNGLLDLRTMSLSHHSPDHISTAQSPASYIPESKCEKWLNFMNQVTDGSSELIEYLQEVVGYCSLTNDTSQHAAFFIYGSGGNGKGTFVLIVCSLVDDALVHHATIEQITGRFGASQMIDKRLVIVDEPNLKDFKSEVFRKYVSGEPAQAELKGVSEFISFKPRARFIITTNEPPRYDEANDGNARRFHIIPFNKKFSGEGRILDLASKIISEEKDGILLWAIEGLKRLQKRGSFQRPEIVIKEQKIIGRDNSSVKSFIAENFKIESNGDFCFNYDKNELYSLYSAFCARNGMHRKASSRFVQDMKVISGIKYDMEDDRVAVFTNLMSSESLQGLKEYREKWIGHSNGKLSDSVT